MSTLRNRVQLIGHLGAEPEMKTLESGARVARINLATNESYKLQNGEWKEETMWHTVIGWNQLAERMQQQLNKGSFVMIEGKLVNRSYTDAAGVKKYFTEVRAVSMMKLDKKTSESSQQIQDDIQEEVHDDGLPF
ncbi:single-stranded DNA-binding protein [Taibaiella lutea]|uniref:Single-stranded DNA-binding protein n=1 Tax=Taibaiella lutea TaxID=2608001 RepID=A0A5M6CB35_9BACT|nr:single-stranded DNA-binding protein [Taibaiella lutea]KAA5532203.1 single-stranded DNA-binding protein [Taibaiella lutea]